MGRRGDLSLVGSGISLSGLEAHRGCSPVISQLGHGYRIIGQFLIVRRRKSRNPDDATIGRADHRKRLATSGGDLVVDKQITELGRAGRAERAIAIAVLPGTDGKGGLKMSHVGLARRVDFTGKDACSIRRAEREKFERERRAIRQLKWRRGSQ